MLTTTERERIQQTAIEQQRAEREQRARDRFNGTDGQDRDSYTDTQDRQNYTASDEDDEDEPEPEEMPDPWADEGQSDARELARDRYDD
jgi:hypothetical protein